MNDTRKIEEQTKEELLKDCELSLEDLEKVSGGKKERIKPELFVTFQNFLNQGEN